MKNKIKLILIGFSLMIMLTACGNMQVWDFEYSFDYAYIYNGEEWNCYKIESWRDYEDSDQMQIKIDGKYYVVNSKYCILSQDDSNSEVFKNLVKGGKS